MRSRLLLELTTPEVEAYLAQGGKTALLPVGCVEMHGPHQPIGTDSIVAKAFALRIADVFRLDADLIEPTTTEKLNQTAPRPLRSGLVVDKIVRETGAEFSSVFQGLSVMEAQMRQANKCK